MTLDEQIDNILEELVFCGRDNLGTHEEAELARKRIKALIHARERLARETVIKELWETNSTNDDIAESLRLMYCELTKQEEQE